MQAPTRIRAPPLAPAQVAVFLRGNPEIDAAADGQPLPAPRSAGDAPAAADIGSGDSSASDDGSGEGVNVGAIVGITVGATLALVAAAGAAVWWIKRRERRGPQASPAKGSSKFERCGGSRGVWRCSVQLAQC